MKIRFRMPQLFAGPWPDSNAWATKAFLGLIVLAVVCGPVALSIAAASHSSAPVAAAPGPGAAGESPVTDPGVDRARDRAQVEAAAFVEVWLSSSRDQAGQVAEMLMDPPDDLHLPAKRVGRVVADAITAEPAPVEGRWSVTVRSRHTDGARWWLVEVLVDGDSATITALPGQIPAPARPDRDDQPELGQLASAHPAADAASEFLTAMLTGKGDITRWSSPGSAPAAIDPAPCTKVKVTATSVTDAIPDIPETSQEVDLVANVTCTTADDSTLLTQYGLHLQGRDGRWEVANITTPARQQSS